MENAPDPISPVAYKDALTSAPSLTSAWRACHAAQFFQRLENEFAKLPIIQPNVDPELPMDEYRVKLEEAWKDEAFSAKYSQQSAVNYAKALSTLLDRNPDELKLLTNADLARLVSMTVSAHDDTPADLDQLQEIYGEYSIEDDKSFASFDARKKFQFYLTLGNDPVIRQISETGEEPALSQEEKLALVERITAAQSKIYGYPAPAIKVDSLTGDPESPDDDKYAEYYSSDNSFTIDKTLMESGTLKDIISSAIHENDHAFQATLIDRLRAIVAHEEEKFPSDAPFDILNQKQMVAYHNVMSSFMTSNLPGGMANEINRNLLLGGQLCQTAYSLAGNERFYFETGSGPGYHQNPSEKHSVSAEAAVDYLYGTGREGFEILRGLAATERESREADTAHRREMERLNPDRPCPAQPVVPVPAV